MQDPRFRLASLFFLSAAAWSSLIGALLALIWWLCCTRGETSIRSLRQFLLFLLVPAIMGFSAFLSGQDGFSYFCRITTILILASWMYRERYPGELLDIGVWFGGKRTGFDLGLVGELSMSALEELAGEIDLVSVAIRQKGEKLRVTSIPALVTVLLVRQLRLARDRACLLTIRGYHGGGSHSPVFVTTGYDLAAGAFSFVILVFSLATRDFFIISGSTFIV
ncbi:MAG: hypothetical protein LUQ07_02255 [Methanospirillum sp.]|nr:hypothetical protein [Methanospirillum sp.]